MNILDLFKSLAVRRLRPAIDRKSARQRKSDQHVIETIPPAARKQNYLNARRSAWKAYKPFGSWWR